MGRQQTLKKNAQATELLASGEAYTGNAAIFGTSAFEKDGEGLAKDLEINLIHLVPNVLEKTSPGDNITIDPTTQPFTVTTRYGKVGDVPSRYEEVIRQNQYYRGTALQIRLNPRGLRVRLSR
jgi:hypothetical protein